MEQPTNSGSCRSSAPWPFHRLTSTGPLPWGPPTRVTPRSHESGQTLVALLFFVLVGIIVVTAAIIILSVNSLAAGKLSQGEIARQLAESGAEEALISLLRNKNYTGETLTIGSDTVVISVVSSGPNVTIDSVATSGNFIRKVEVTASINDVLTPTSWKEIY